MGTPTEIANVGLEAFGLLEASLRAPQKRPTLNQNRPHHQLHLHSATRQVVHARERETIDCYQAAKKYGGLVIAEYRTTTKPPLRQMY
ncbi:hypothetical protein CsSME_00047385 [Camellia sinensis var. sinensis]